MKRSRIITGASSLMMLLMMMVSFLSSRCSGIPVQYTDAQPPAPGLIVEVAGMAAFYKEGQEDRELGIIINEYEYDERNSIIGVVQIGSAHVGTTDGRRIIRQSLCKSSGAFRIPKNYVRPRERLLVVRYLSTDTLLQISFFPSYIVAEILILFLKLLSSFAIFVLIFKGKGRIVVEQNSCWSV